jgi:hypothetical protein
VEHPRLRDKVDQNKSKATGDQADQVKKFSIDLDFGSYKGKYQCKNHRNETVGPEVTSNTVGCIIVGF